MRNAFALVIGCLIGTASGQGITFGLLTDSHQADKVTSGTRYYRSTMAKMTQAVDTFQAHALPFLVHLGDFIDGYNANDSTLAFNDIDSVNGRFSRFTGEKYAVLGNHDMASLSKTQFLGRAAIAVKQNYYSFDKGNYHFVVLDGNYRSDSSDFNHANFTWSDAWVSPAEKRWLTVDLADAGSKMVFVMVHEILDSTVTSGECLKNANEIRKIFENAGNVKAVFSGHMHGGGYKLFNGIHYLVMKAMVENALPANSYAEAAVSPAGDSLFIRGYGSQPSFRLKLTASTGVLDGFVKDRRHAVSMREIATAGYPRARGFYNLLGRQMGDRKVGQQLYIIKNCIGGGSSKNIFLMSHR